MSQMSPEEEEAVQAELEALQQESMVCVSPLLRKTPVLTRAASCIECASPDASQSTKRARGRTGRHRHRRGGCGR
jgi:hypothetical protein